MDFQGANYYDELLSFYILKSYLPNIPKFSRAMIINSIKKVTNLITVNHESINNHKKALLIGPFSNQINPKSLMKAWTVSHIDLANNHSFSGTFFPTLLYQPPYFIFPIIYQTQAQKRKYKIHIAKANNSSCFLPFREGAFHSHHFQSSD